jgi:hypothetical protein
MNHYTLEIKLESDTAFGSGSGISALINNEIQHDEKGLPTISGRAIKGLLVNECSEILYALPTEKREGWEKAALQLFGQRGEMLDDVAGVFIADATLPPDLVAAVHDSVRDDIHDEKRLTRQNVLDSLTTIRKQTAMNEKGAPQDETLRSTRVLIKGLTLYAPLTFTTPPGENEKALLAACTMSLRHAGLNRTRGKGKIKVTITERPLTPLEFSKTTEEQFNDKAADWFKHFAKEVIK